MAIISTLPKASQSFLGSTMSMYRLNNNTTARYVPPNHTTTVTGTAPSAANGIDSESNGAVTWAGASSSDLTLGFNHTRGLNGITVALWYYAVSADVTGSRTVYSINNGANLPHNVRFFNGFDSNKLLISNDGLDATANFGTNAATLDTWYHLAFVWDGTTNNPNFTLYHNGVQVNTWYSSATTSYITSTTTHYIGRRPSNSTSWNGRISRVWTWNENKSATFIRQLYERRI